MKHTLFRFLREEDGATMIEYAIMIALIAAVCIGTVRILGNSVQQTLWDRITGAWS